MIHRLLVSVFGLLPQRAQRLVFWLVGPKTSVGASVAALDAQGNVLLFQHRYHRGRPWRLPGGHLRRKETPADALHRELEEEGGARVELGQLVHVGVSSRWPNRMTLYYSARLLHVPERPTAEVAAWRLWPAASLPPGMPGEQADAVRLAAAALGSGTGPAD